MRFVCFLLLFVLTILEFAPIPITSVLLLWVVLFRPAWFYRLVQAVYKDAIPPEDGEETKEAQEQTPQANRPDARL